MSIDDRQAQFLELLDLLRDGREARLQIGGSLRAGRGFGIALAI
ncbi:MAG: hypothetical protein AB7M05_15945 [Alphaproteobacteria bacterium]